MEALSGIDSSLMWFVIGIVLLVLEAATPGFFWIFFGFGALVVSGLTFLTPINDTLQWAIFLVISVISLLIFRERVKLLFQGRKTGGDSLDDPIVAEQYIGREVLVLKNISKEEPGLVELNGTNWQARTEGRGLEVGQRAKILRLEGLVLIVAAPDHVPS